VDRLHLGLHALHLHVEAEVDEAEMFKGFNLSEIHAAQSVAARGRSNTIAGQ
jgi:hypothetical protein